MRKLFITCLLIFGTLPVLTDPAYLAGLSYSLNGDFGITAKVLSNGEQDEIVVVAGATYYPFSEYKFGIDLGAGYTFNDSAASVSWDFLQQSIQLSAGYSEIEDESITVTPTCPPSTVFDGISYI